MKLLILSVLATGLMIGSMTVSAELEETPDAAVQILGCQEITQAKSSFHLSIERVNTGTHGSSLTAKVFFNVESTPRVTFSNCKGNEDVGFSCVYVGKKHSLQTFKTGSNQQFHVAVLRRSVPDGQVANSFTCE